MAAMLKTALVAMCVFTLLATAFLTASLLVLQPPRANYQQWAFVASVIVAQGVLTLVAVTRSHASAWLRLVVSAAGGVLAVIGVWMVRNTLTSSHFEGYALVLGSVLIVQGALTIGAFLRLQDFRMAG